ncbi:hypothetical protein ACWC4A_53455 [Streptomyces mirabilis]|uniref:hypothetical protein n=1 Tax=Streptomyces mirabilis TaxID=68239 RepID=UPI0035D75D41
MIEQIATLAMFGAAWAVLSVGHNLADHVIGQTDHQAAGKAAPSADEVADGVSPQVQSTDPALHRAIGIGAAAVTTWLTTRPGARQ